MQYKMVSLKTLFSLSLILIFFSIFSFYQFVADVALDASWITSIDYFYEHSYKLGSEIAFTYGPAAPIFLKAYSHDLYWAKVSFSGLMALVTCFIYWKWSQRSSLASLIFLGIGLIICADNDSYIFSLQLLILSLLLFSVKIKKREVWIVLSFLFLSLLGLIKFTFLLSGLFLTILFVVSAIIRKDKKAAICSMAAFMLGAIFFWLVFGQSITDIPLYLQSSLNLSSAYSEAMSLEAPIASIYVGVFLVALSLFIIPFKTIVKTKNNQKMIIMLIAIGGVGFMLWKESFVRNDLHILNFFSFTCVLAAFLIFIIDETPTKALIIWRWITAKLIKNVIIVAIVCASIGCLIVAEHKAGSTSNILANKLNMYQSMFRLVTHPNQIVDNREGFDNQVLSLKVSSDLPEIRKIIGNGTVDLYNYEQNYVILNGFNWQPRPVFQSYSAYNSFLLKLNRDKLLSNQTEFLLFKNETIDERLPLLDDSLWIREMMHHYVPVIIEQNLLLLKKIPETQQIPTQLKTEVQKTVKFGEEIELPSNEDLTDIKLDIEYSILGKLKAFILKPPLVNIKLNLSNGETKQFRIIPSMTKEPFIISPLIETNEDLLLTYLEENPKKVKSFQVDSTGNAKYFKKNIDLEVYFDKVVSGFDRNQYNVIMGARKG